jgi:hypothetical protein
MDLKPLPRFRSNKKTVKSKLDITANEVDPDSDPRVALNIDIVPMGRIKG